MKKTHANDDEIHANHRQILNDQNKQNAHLWCEIYIKRKRFVGCIHNTADKSDIITKILVMINVERLNIWITGHFLQ